MFVLLIVFYVESCKSVHLLSNVIVKCGQKAISNLQSPSGILGSEREGRRLHKGSLMCLNVEMTSITSTQATWVLT